MNRRGPNGHKKPEEGFLPDPIECPRCGGDRAYPSAVGVRWGLAVFCVAAVVLLVPAGIGLILVGLLVVGGGAVLCAVALAGLAVHAIVRARSKMVTCRICGYEWDVNKLAGG
jgi:rubredoxin